MKKIFIILLFILIHSAFAEIITDDDYGYELDIPENFELNQSTPDNKSFLFYYKKTNVYLILKICDYGGEDTKAPITSAKTALCVTLDKIFADYSVDTFDYYGTPVAISNGTTSFTDTSKMQSEYANKDSMSFWAESADLKGKNAAVVLISYTPKLSFVLNQQFITSTLNSLVLKNITDTATMGLFTYYAYPSKMAKGVTLRINGHDVKTSLCIDDAEAARFVIDCEWAVLSQYAGDEKWQEAWVRYYRAIFRDSFARLNTISTDIYSAIIGDAKKANKNDPNAALNEILLSWVQSFSYERDNKTASASDFTALPEIFLGKGSDCDSRSLLMCVLLKHMGLDTCLFVSQEYHHAIYGAQVNIKGAKINVDNKWYLLGETTAKNIAPGFIAQTMNDTDKWIPVTIK